MKILLVPILAFALVLPPAPTAAESPLSSNPAPQPRLFGTDVLAALITFFKLYLQIQMRHDTQRVVNANHDAANEINELRQNIFNLETMMKFLPAPGACEWLLNTRTARRLMRIVRELVEDQDLRALGEWQRIAADARADLARVRDRAPFCDALDVQRGLCSRPGELPNGDVSAAVLWSADQLTGIRQQAARRYVGNVINTRPLPVPTNILDTPQGQALAAERLTILALKSMANTALLDQVIEREPRDGGRSTRQSWLDEADTRYASAEWLQRIHDEDASPAALKREELLMRSWQMQMDKRLYQQNERIIALLSALVSAQADRKQAELVQQIDAAMRAQPEFREPGS